MRWKLFADLAEVAGTDELRVTGDPETVGDALDALVADRPALADRVLENGELADHVNLLRNGERVERDEPVEAEDELALFPPVSGG